MGITHNTNKLKHVVEIPHTMINFESFYVIFQKRVRVFHRGFKHEKTIKALGLRPRAFIVFECLKHRRTGTFGLGGGGGR